MSVQYSALAQFDPEIAQAIAAEECRQVDTLNLIASENHTHLEVLATNASVLTDKYAEGYPGIVFDNPKNFREENSGTWLCPV